MAGAPAIGHYAAGQPVTVLNAVLAAGDDQQKAAPLGLFVLLLLGVACYFLFRSMSRHLKRVREDFPIGVPDPGPGPGSGSRPGPRPGGPGSVAAAPSRPSPTAGDGIAPGPDEVTPPSQ